MVALLPAGAAITIFLSRFGGSLWFCMIVAILCIVHMDGKPIMDIRRALKELSLIHILKYKELDFTVPEFDGFIKRLEEYQEWRLAEKL